MFALSRHGSTLIAFVIALIVSVGMPANAAAKPGNPTGLKSAVTSSSATLSWSKATNAKQYSVCLMTSGTTTRCYRTSYKKATTSVTFYKLKPTGGTDYYWKVRAFNGSLTSTSVKAKFDLAPKAAPAPVTTKPAAPTDIKNAVSTSGVNVTWAAAKNAKNYRVCLLSSESSTACERLSDVSASTSATFANLASTGGTDWFVRVHAYNGSAFTLSSRVPFDLPVAGVTGLSLSDVTTKSVRVDWNAVTNAGAYEVQYANSPGMTINFRTVTTSGTSYPLTGLTPGKTYYVKVRGTNDAVAGPLASAPGQRLPTDRFTATVVTYNLCGQDKCATPGNGIKPWSTRKPIAGQIAREATADLIATQESHTDDTNFITQLPGFKVAAYRSAKTLYYRTAMITKIRSGTITLNSGRKKYAVWAEFQDRASKTPFIMADAHLTSGKSKTYDDMRKAETKILLAQIAAVNTAGVPVVYAGDFNSNKSNRNKPGGYDAPDQVFAAAGIPDSFRTTDDPYNTAWNSANQARATPPYKNGDHIDHIYVDPRIIVGRWQTMIRLSNPNTYKTPFATDHNPVRVVLTIPGAS